MHMTHSSAPWHAQEQLPLSLRQQRKTLQRQRCIRTAASADYRDREPKDIRVLVVGATGYIGKFVVKELIKRGYNVVAFAREKSGVGGKAGMEDTKQVSHRVAIPSTQFRSLSHLQQCEQQAAEMPVTEPSQRQRLTCCWMHSIVSMCGPRRRSRGQTSALETLRTWPLSAV